MAKGRPGSDSSTLATSQINGQGLIQLARDLFGEFPVFWGRYFTSTSAAGNVEYRHRKENQPLRENGIRVLTIARQTKNVNSSLDVGVATDKPTPKTSLRRLDLITLGLKVGDSLSSSTSRDRQACQKATTRVGRRRSKPAVRP
jgi:hypothetical protein